MTQMFQRVGCTSCRTSGWRTSSHQREWGEYLFYLTVFTPLRYKTDPSRQTCLLFSAAPTSSVFPVCCLLEEWPGSLTGQSLFHPTSSSLVTRQVRFRFQFPDSFKINNSKCPCRSCCFVCLPLSSWRKISQWFPGRSAGADQRRGCSLAV